MAKLIIIAGCAGSGKTTLGKQLAKELEYAYVDKDTITMDYTDFVLCKLGSFEGDRDSDLYKNEIRPMEYDVTFKVCKDILDSDGNVILAIPFIGQIKNYKMWEDLRDKHSLNNITVKFVWIQHDSEREKRNIINRNADRDKYKLEHWEEYSAPLDGIHPDSQYNAYIYSDGLNSVHSLKKWILEC